MRIDLGDLRRHYASLPDGELLALNREDLTDAGQTVYDEEMARRGLIAGSEPEEEEFEGEETEAAEEDFEELPDDDTEAPAWLEDGAAACSFVAYPGSSAADRASQSRHVLRAAGIPCYLTVTQEQSDEQSRDVFHVMVPGAFALHATSILDRDLFNEEHESEWRGHFEALSDEDLQALDPKIFTAGLLDRVARMKRVYAEEMSARKLKARG